MTEQKKPVSRRLTLREWFAEGEELFGTNHHDWKFVCPSCGYVASVADWKNAGAGEGEVAFSCVGRALGSKNELGSKKRPCNYAGGGLFRLNPVTVVFEDGYHERQTFEFARPEDQKRNQHENHQTGNRKCAARQSRDD